MHFIVSPRCSQSSCQERSAAPRLAMKFILQDAGRECWCSRNHALIRRLSLFREAAFDTFLLIVMPNAGPSGSGNTGTRKYRDRIAFSARVNSIYSWWALTQRIITYTQSDFLPLALRRANTLRPFLVAMRLRKPWVFLRDLFEGW